ncbi:MAG: hypothetical protein KJ646_01115 [Nanoarchaeota archaeon]|nr:hypothetical protein [Nanoarchaeota archaeon]MBU4117097.1 hypothetical protein [Nanoarchaeota archaeon]MBU4311049.1 hypothetical protein [bacterium]
MEAKVKGAWIIHHTNKLNSVAISSPEYEQLTFAGKCGMLLNGVAASEQTTLSKSRVNVLASAAGISTRLELPVIIEELKRQRLIDESSNEITVLGLSTGDTLSHAARIYEEAKPTATEQASIEIAESVSECPLSGKIVSEQISDSFKIKSSDTKDIIRQFNDIGFVDSESIGNDKIFFNGNLFRKDNIRKINGVLSSLSSAEEGKIRNLLAILDNKGCISLEEALVVTSQEIIDKIISIAFIDINTIGNEIGTYMYVTRPSAFKKFSNPVVDDAFDLAKAFLTSLTFGMTKSSYYRGRIKMIEALMNKLIQGYWVGPATAIGQDYKILEFKGVIQVRPEENGMFSMKLLKRDIGELAYKVISEGEASTSSMAQFPSVSATKYIGPEPNRTVKRKKQSVPLKKGIATLLNDLRTGGIK